MRTITKDSYSARAEMEKVYYEQCLRYVVTQIKDLSPGIDTTFSNYKDLESTREALTQRIHSTNLLLEREASYAQEFKTHGIVSFRIPTSRGGTYRSR